MQKPVEQVEADPTVRGGPRGWLLSVAVAAAVGIAYFLAAHLGLALLSTPERVAIFWPAAGIAAGALIALGRWARAPVVLAVISSSVAASLLSDRNIWSALAFGFCNAGEALVVMWLIERWFGPAFNLDSLRRVLGFFAAAAVATAAAAVGATGAMQLFGPSTAAFIDVWRVWFVSDALGLITVAPLLIGSAAAVRDAPSSRELIEGTVVVGAVAITIVLLLAILSGPWSLIGPSSILFPLLLWLGYRCRPVFAAAAAFTIAAAIVLTTTNEFGRYGDPAQPIAIRVVAAQIVMLGTTLVALALAALFAERRRHEATIIASELHLRSILDAANVIAWEADLVRNSVHSTGPVGRLLDRPGSEPYDFAGIVKKIHPEDRDRVMAQFWKAVSTNAAYQLEFRLCSSGGSARWVTAEGLIERDSHGRPVRVRGITRDVTERKQAEQGLQESERKLRELLGALPAAIHTTDTAGRITFCNKAAVDLWGVSPELGKDKCS
ncbi:MAG: MASE1 domain-containing protein, partial [Hyphomicrobiaceae bacterium]